MVECLADYLCEQLTETLLAFSSSTPEPPINSTCDLKRLLLSHHKHNLGPWRGREAAVPTPIKPRGSKKGRSTPSHTGAPPLPIHPFSFSHIVNYVYPSPYIREYCRLVRLSQDAANHSRLPELKIKPITLPCLGVSNTQSIPSNSGSGKSTSSLTKALCLQGSVHNLAPDFKLPFLKLEGEGLQNKRKRTGQGKKKRSSKATLRSCSLVNLGLDLFHQPAMIICPKKITILKHENSKNKDKNQWGLPKI